MRYVSMQQTIQYSICKISDIACGPLFRTVLVSWYPHHAHSECDTHKAILSGHVIEYLCCLCKHLYWVVYNSVCSARQESLKCSTHGQASQLIHAQTNIQAHKLEFLFHISSIVCQGRVMLCLSEQSTSYWSRALAHMNHFLVQADAVKKS